MLFIVMGTSAYILIKMYQNNSFNQNYLVATLIIVENNATLYYCIPFLTKCKSVFV